MIRKAIAAGALAALAVPAAAQAHVTVQPQTAPAGGFAVEDVRVPTELDNASTVKVDVLLPPGFAEAAYQAVPGWRVKVTKEKLSTPIQTDDGPVTEEVRRITWTATSTAAGIAPGQFQDFPLSVQLPDKAGTALTFKAVQTYSNGKVVRWIGPPSSDSPAPQVKLVKASAPAAAAGSSSAPRASSSRGASKGLAITALVVGALGLLAGGAALATGRRRAA